MQPGAGLGWAGLGWAGGLMAPPPLRGSGGSAHVIRGGDSVVTRWGCHNEKEGIIWAGCMLLDACTWDWDAIWTRGGGADTGAEGSSWKEGEMARNCLTLVDMPCVPSLQGKRPSKAGIMF